MASAAASAASSAANSAAPTAATAAKDSDPNEEHDSGPTKEKSEGPFGIVKAPKLETKKAPKQSKTIQELNEKLRSEMWCGISGCVVGAVVAFIFFIFAYASSNGKPMFITVLDVRSIKA